MTKFEFWAIIDHGNNIVEIPDEELTGLSEEQRQAVILEHHIKWCKRSLFGDWRELTN